MVDFLRGRIMAQDLAAQLCVDSKRNNIIKDGELKHHWTCKIGKNDIIKSI